MKATIVDYGKKLDQDINTLVQSQVSEGTPYYGLKDLTFNDFIADKMMVISAIQKGIPYSLFETIRHLTPLTENDWANFLDLSTKSLSRYKAGARAFKPIQSEKILEIAEVIHVGTEVFGDPEKFRLWLDTPNFALGNVKPLYLLKDSYGKELVIASLMRISHGIFV